MNKISLSINEVIKATGIGRTKLYELLKNNNLPAKKIGKRTVILATDLENFLLNADSYKSNVGGA